jgi:hypothetical protein
MSVSIIPGATALTVIGPRRHFARQRLDEPLEPGLRRGVVGLSRRCPSVRTTELTADDPAAALLEHRPHGGLRQDEHGGEVGGHHGVPVLALHAHEQLIACDAGVADDDIEPPVPIDDSRGYRLQGGRIRHVDAERFGLQAARLQRGHAVVGVIAARRGHHGRLLRREPFRNRAPDATRCSGHQGDFAGEIEHQDRVRADSTAARSSGPPKLTIVALRWILRTRPLNAVPGPTSTYVVTPSDARRVTTASQPHR